LAGLFDQPSGLVEVLRRGQGISDGVDVVAQVDGDDVGTLLGQPNRMASSLPARGAG
jgi:hypothetical protein